MRKGLLENCIHGYWASLCFIYFLAGELPDIGRYASPAIELPLLIQLTLGLNCGFIDASVFPAFHLLIKLWPHNLIQSIYYYYKN